jgi:hypothetical protein
LSAALIVVHGIGTQQRGDTLYQCASGLLTVCAGSQLLDESGGVIAAEEIRARRLDCASLRQGGFVLRLYEVYWAVMGWWAVVAWFLFTTKDGYSRSRTRHERSWR